MPWDAGDEGIVASIAVLGLVARANGKRIINLYRSQSHELDHICIYMGSVIEEIIIPLHQHFHVDSNNWSSIVKPFFNANPLYN